MPQTLMVIVCLRFSAVRRWRIFLASMASREEGIALEVTASSAIVSLAAGDFLRAAGELFPLPLLDFFFFRGFVVAISPEDGALLFFKVVVLGRPDIAGSGACSSCC